MNPRRFSSFETFGSLMYAMVCTRPDISQAIGVVSRYMHDSRKGHWQAVKWILRYLRKTRDFGLIFEHDKTHGQCLVGYVDSDYAGDFDKRRSTTIYLSIFEHDHQVLHSRTKH